jgi:hypothetical protein
MPHGIQKLLPTKKPRKNRGFFVKKEAVFRFFLRSRPEALSDP